MSETYLEALTSSMTATPAFDGLPAKIIHLENAVGMTVSLMDIGATWLSCRVPAGNEKREVLLRAKDMPAHQAQSAYLGATVGRFANRIKAGQFEVDGQSFDVTTNNLGNALHGGTEGFDKRRWDVIAASKQSAAFRLISPDGDQGFPGNLSVTVTYTLSDDNSLSIDYEAQCDRTCPVSLTNHAYFNLDGESSGESIKKHALWLGAARFLASDEALIPTGQVRDVKETGLDFTQQKTIERDFMKDEAQRLAAGYDHAFWFDEKDCDGEKRVARLVSSSADLAMSVATTMPAIQVYTGNFLEGTQGASGDYLNRAGIALETQFLPDGPNHPEWGKAGGILEEGEVYRHVTRYQFSGK
ncbi:Aldose 1-epimerase [Grimontia celer]|uniref:Aldose 1-epimerase n=1 Tax=Grimontia celer TaxID=1796497 RepID=A0A128FAE4_9GAMM|nr:galactose-1-epimerase [Grimontia celer]CZF83276.1 Aldose 1-epimerase [Grimontia celer]